MVGDLFEAFLAEPRLLPPEFQARAGEDKARAIADYVAGMTDRYATSSTGGSSRSKRPERTVAMLWRPDFHLK